MDSSKLSPPQTQYNKISDYQKATLQAMGIAVYERRGLTPLNSADTPKPIDESSPFIRQILQVFNVASSQEMGLTWQIHEIDVISLKESILSTPEPAALTSFRLKKQLWNVLQSRFKAQEWS